MKSPSPQYGTLVSVVRIGKEGDQHTRSRPQSRGKRRWLMRGSKHVVCGYANGWKPDRIIKVHFFLPLFHCHVRGGSQLTCSAQICKSSVGLFIAALPCRFERLFGYLEANLDEMGTADDFVDLQE